VTCNVKEEHLLETKIRFWVRNDLCCDMIIKIGVLKDIPERTEIGGNLETRREKLKKDTIKTNVKNERRDKLHRR
jgi:hypothetical protein